MSDFVDSQSEEILLEIPDLSQQARQRLGDTARRRGCSPQEEAEHLLRAHLDAWLDDEGRRGKP